MKLLYSNILPLGTEEGQETIIDCFKEQLSRADRIEIAVGYVSRASLEELDELVSQYDIHSICLNIGMYYIEGMPEGSYHTAVKINRKWAASGIGKYALFVLLNIMEKHSAFTKTGNLSQQSLAPQIWVYLNLKLLTAGSMNCPR